MAELGRSVVGSFQHVAILGGGDQGEENKESGRQGSVPFQQSTSSTPGH